MAKTTESPTKKKESPVKKKQQDNSPTKKKQDSPKKKKQESPKKKASADEENYPMEDVICSMITFKTPFNLFLTLR